MNKGAKIGIVIAIIVAGIAGIYAVTSDSDENKTPTVGLDDSATAIVVDEVSETPGQEEKIGFSDFAIGEVEEPVESTDVFNVTVQERLGIKDPKEP